MIPTTCVISIWSDDIKCNCMFLFPLKNLACKGLNTVDDVWQNGSWPVLVLLILSSCVVDAKPLLNTLRQWKNGCHFPDDMLICIFVNENVWISLKISLKFVRKIPISNIPALVQIMALHPSGDKPLSEPMMVYLSDAYMRHSASMS